MQRFFSAVPRMVFATVKRMDTHGVTYVVKEGLPLKKAQEMAENMEATGHKQTYWVEVEDKNLNEKSHTSDEHSRPAV